MEPPLLLLKRLVHQFDFLLIGSVTLVPQLAHGPCIRLYLRHWVFGVCVSDGQEVVIIQDFTSLLHNSEGALRTRPLNVPADIIIDTLHRYE